MFQVLSPPAEAIVAFTDDVWLGTCEGNKKLAASLLGIHRSTLYAKLARYGLR